ncbi:hypothetical protein [Thioflexithrix psekupsensis]|uniref:Cardiolipin synthase N-terminal domain-containing protein n=1 Tax=Thioflexithrix psekupsensis TaxID=1570016 RepID=A0A251XD76_9GAMM|nr:hypothetical protein [Thioflexithrix psekupsensis]OUD16170.1 hypothetical protein TPSD3_00125 [Thioflexithrix psekupsensis]
MPILIILSTLLQVFFIVHVIKTGRERYWIFIILLFPFLGSAAYFFIELLPEIRQGRAGREISKKILTAIDPQRDLKERVKQLHLSDNVHNKIELAQECRRFGLLDDAIKLYRDSLTGIYAHDPDIMLNLAQVLFLKEEYAQVKIELDALIQHNPDFKSQEGYLLYARTLEALKEDEAALAEYRVLNDYYSGYEARCRYALFLKKLGHTEHASQLFNDILQRAQSLPKDRRKIQQDWIDIAKQQIENS